MYSYESVTTAFDKSYRPHETHEAPWPTDLDRVVEIRPDRFYRIMRFLELTLIWRCDALGAVTGRVPVVFERDEQEAMVKLATHLNRYERNE